MASVGSVDWHLNLRQRSVILRGQGGGLPRLGYLFTGAILRYNYLVSDVLAWPECHTLHHK